MKINDIRDIAIVRMEPERALRNPHFRYQHYMRCYLDRPEDFLVGYSGHSLIFSDIFSYTEIDEYEKLFKNFAKAKELDSRGQATRMKKISKIFGKQGVLAARKMFKNCH